MRHSPSTSRSLRFLVPALLVASISCKSSETTGASGTTTDTSKTAQITNDYEVDAQVVAISQPDRRATFRRGDGNMFDIVAGDAVRNFDQLTVGQQLRVRYRESLRATILPPGEEVKVTQAAYGSSRAPEGAKPAGTAAVAIGARVKVTSVDITNEIVTYQLPTGDFAARRVRTAEGREFLKKLKVGDIVQLDIQQSLALEIH